MGKDIEDNYPNNNEDKNTNSSLLDRSSFDQVYVLIVVGTPAIIERKV